MWRSPAEKYDRRKTSGMTSTRTCVTARKARGNHSGASVVNPTANRNSVSG
jgi:hypothetical protein